MYMRVLKAAVLLAAFLVAVPQSYGAQDEEHAAPTEAVESGDAGSHDGSDAHDEHGEHPEGEAHGEHELNLNPLDQNDLKSDLAIWTGVVFVLLLLVLGKFAWGPIVDGLDKRESRIAGEIQAAEKANADGKALLAEYQQKLSAAGDEVRQILEQAKRDAEAAGQAIVQKARDEAEAEKRRATEDIELATAGALKEIAEKSAGLAVDLAGKIVRQRLSAEDHATLVQEAVAKFAKLEPGKN